MICYSSVASAEQTDEELEINKFIQKMYRTRAGLLLKNDEGLVSGFYLDHVKSSQYAKEAELKRGRYLRAWAERRNIKLMSAETSIRINRLKKEQTIVRASIVQTMKITYQYDDPAIAPQPFGVGTRHVLKLQKKGDQWYVLREWYLDPFDENPDLIPALEQGKSLDETLKRPPDVPLSGKRTGSRFNREQAIAYANKYAGAAWGAGNDNRYKRSYRDYTGMGGDCTNFVSQVLGDPEEGGGMPMARGWRYSKAGGSLSWVRTDSFKHFVLYSGYGRLVAKGSFSEIMGSNGKYPEGAFHRLLPGDIIAYELAGDIDHFAIFIGLDDKGYPLVNCHTADRYHAPFDLGWDKTTRYLLIHIEG